AIDEEIHDTAILDVHDTPHLAVHNPREDDDVQKERIRVLEAGGPSTSLGTSSDGNDVRVNEGSPLVMRGLRKVYQKADEAEIEWRILRGWWKGFGRKGGWWVWPWGWSRSGKGSSYAPPSSSGSSSSVRDHTQQEGGSNTLPNQSQNDRTAAVEDLTLSIDRGVCFALLGPNGSGKTTTISMLTGLSEATRGTAWIGGFDISKRMDEVYRLIGICPQHDILWDDLTVTEHLLFYARLKGIPPSDEDPVVRSCLRTMQLEGFADQLSRKLSGGAKRRLSIAIALIGDPLVVFLDEPTTGLDPEVRRTIWNIINDAREGRTIVLTTHSMDEAEVLAQRIGIMSRGRLRCLGSPMHLKQKYGSGYRLSFSVENEKDIKRARRFIEAHLPRDHRMLGSFATSGSYEFHPTSGKMIGDLLEILQRRLPGEDLEAPPPMTDFGLSSTTLEEVFLRIIGEEESVE
ncbi:hypothetical protein HK102_014025, partial [Quaeritorhiza haematococci]